MRREILGTRQAKKVIVGAASALLLACGNGGNNQVPPSPVPCTALDGAAGDALTDAGTAGAPDAVACPVAILAEDFEKYAAGAPLDPTWQLVVQGPKSSARINLDAEGHGNGGSNRYVLFTNDGSEPDSVQISATTPAFDVRGCSSVSLTASVIVFSLEETENDHAFVEVRGNGSDWTPMYMPFPSPDFPPLSSCRAGGQETGCVAWKTIRVDIPSVVMGSDLEVRFRLKTLTAVSDFFGFDDVKLVGAP
jgi:hypothetical protein